MRATTFGLKRAGLALALMASLGACTPQYRNHGYAPPEEDLAQIAVGVDSRASVEDLVGVPTTSGMLDERGYYYVRSRVRRFGWRAPEVVDRQVVAVSFDAAGTVSNIERYGLEDGRVVPLARRVTRTNDENVLSLLRRLFGNIGRLTASDLFD